MTLYGLAIIAWLAFLHAYEYVSSKNAATTKAKSPLNWLMHTFHSIYFNDWNAEAGRIDLVACDLFYIRVQSIWFWFMQNLLLLQCIFSVICVRTSSFLSPFSRVFPSSVNVIFCPASFWPSIFCPAFSAQHFWPKLFSLPFFTQPFLLSLFIA